VVPSRTWMVPGKMSQPVSRAAMHACGLPFAREFVADPLENKHLFWNGSSGLEDVIENEGSLPFRVRAEVFLHDADGRRR